MKRITFMLLSLVVIMTSCNNAGKESKQQKIDISAAGATFPLPFYNLVFKEYQDRTGNNVNYGGIGSGGGIRSLKDKVVDFGASDAFLSEKELVDFKSNYGEVVHIPTCMGAVVLAYNLPGIDKLNLSAQLISDIYQGKVKKWNDKAIQAANPGVKLPNKDITPVYRSDGSGTTFIFSDFLTKASPEWAEKMGTGKALNWSMGIAAKGNPGVAGVIKQTEGAMGYIGSEYAFSLGISMAAIQNKQGEYVLPTTESISASAEGDIPADTRVMVTYSDIPSSYPISCFTWILIYKEQAYNNRKIERAQATISLLELLLSDEIQQMTKKVHYCPLPKKAISHANVLLDGMVFDKKKLRK